MPAVYVSRISQWIEKHFNAKGGNVVLDVDQSAVVQLPFLIGVEDRYLQGWNRFGVASVVPAVAAALSAFRLANPAGSNVIAVVERAVLSAGANFTGNIVQVAATNLGTTVPANPFDIRGNPPTVTASFGSNATQVGNSYIIANVLANSNFDYIISTNAEFLMLPGVTVTIWGTALNTGFNASFLWRERALELSELT